MGRGACMQAEGKDIGMRGIGRVVKGCFLVPGPKVLLRPPFNSVWFLFTLYGILPILDGIVAHLVCHCCSV